MDTDKAYILGLIIGGGIWGNPEDGFRIKLPYKQWGDYEKNPKRAGGISKDIMSVVKPMFKNIYGINIGYEASKNEWYILCEGDLSNLISDFEEFNILYEGDFHENINLKNIITSLVDDNLKRRFIAGLADTIGSVAKSHRRFSDEIQILSFEIKGFNFLFGKRNFRFK